MYVGQTNSAYTCSNIIDMGQSAVVITVSDIMAMSDSEFYNCITTFGTVLGWADIQLAALYARFKLVSPYDQ